MKIGDTDVQVLNHVKKVLETMRIQTGYNGEAHSVFVSVYVDGRLEFAGADVLMGKGIDRLSAKNQASVILGRMDPHGELSKPSKPSTLPRVDVEALDLALKLKDKFGQIVQWRGMLTNEEAVLAHVINKYIEKKSDNGDVSK